MPTHIDPCSLAVAPIVPICRDAPLSHATGFVWLAEDGAYLITNWHVVAGRRTDNAQPLSEDKGWVPDRLLARFLHWDGAETIATQYDIALYDAEGKPTWFWHPVYGRQVDVVALRLTSRAPESGYRAINQVALDRDLWTQVGMDVFILGYPLNRKRRSQATALSSIDGA